jgi:energy-coupling factor transporter ATP-binding protein EcfA2
MKKIVNIRIDNYRIYRNEVEIRLPNGENLLIYGENGSGKTSLAKGIANFFDSSISRETEFERNFFNSDETDGQIDISFAEYSPGTPINTTGIQTYRWSSLPSESTNKQRFIQSAARIHGFLDYSRLLKVYLHNEPDPNLFDLIVLDLLGSYYPPAERHTVKGKYDKIQEGLFNVWNRKERAHRRALNELDVFEDNIRETLDNCFRTVNSWLNDHFRHLALTVDYVLAPMEFRYGKCKKDWNIIQDLRLRIIGFDHNIRKYNHVLNEARLSAISMLIFLAVIKENPELCQYKFLYLDDAFIGLDNSNRRQILNIIKKDFTDWQVFISTYDLTWYHAACSILDGSWTKLEIYECLESGRQNIPLSVVTYRDEPMANLYKNPEIFTPAE